MRILRYILLPLLILIPLASLLHRTDSGHLDLQRSAMAAPDEFSYLLMAQNFLRGGGLSLEHSLGRDTFYPPGYPLLLAAWGKLFGMTAISAHALNTTLLCAAVAITFFFSRRLLAQLLPDLSARAADLLALLIAGLFATNWHVLETSLLLMSEPLFMLTTFAWLALAIRWPHWPAKPLQALAISLLAVAAWSVRGAGIVCVATTLLYPLLHALAQWKSSRTLAPTPAPFPTAAAPLRHSSFIIRIFPFALVLALPILYQLVLVLFSPEKSLFTPHDSANSYTKQLLHGLTVDAPAPGDPHPTYTLLRAWFHQIYNLISGHLADFAASFVPWPRLEPDATFRTNIGRLLALLSIAGLLTHLYQTSHSFFSHKPSTARIPPEQSPAQSPFQHSAFRIQHLPITFLDLYLFFYAALYILWPFNFARFWSPILPFMLIYIVYVVARLRIPLTPVLIRHSSFVIRHFSTFLSATLLALLFLLSSEELVIQIGNYSRRLNHVSDALANAVHNILLASPSATPARPALVAGMGDDELYALAWYSSQDPLYTQNPARFQLCAPLPHLPTTGKHERADQLLLRLLSDLKHQPSPLTPQPSELAPQPSELAPQPSELAPQPSRLFFLSYFPNQDTRDTLLSVRTQVPTVTILPLRHQEDIVATYELYPSVP
jgi:hypothetical protein